MPIPLKHNTQLIIIEKYREVSFEYFDSSGDKKCILDNNNKGSTDMSDTDDAGPPVAPVCVDQVWDKMIS